MAEREKPKTTEAIPAEYAKAHWQPIAYTLTEGEAWRPIPEGADAPLNYSALQYRCGWIFDNVLKQMNVNPWRHIED